MRQAFLILCLVCAGAAHAGGLAQLQHFWRETRALEGAFVQSTVGKEGKKAKNASGRFALARPGRLRLDYEKPFRLLILVDGERFLSWDAELSQLVISPSHARLGTTPAALLTQEALDKHFALAEAGSEAGLDLVEARPKSPEAGFEWVRVALADNLPRRIEVRDRFGQTTTVLLTELRPAARLSAELFRFTPPPGAEVITAGN
ncbi:MAG: outer membrane lipoprotein carrier protein LolA [Rhodocyclaceae bacterium]|nr:outer membrane lipoprotein carrier protein LolA [Rhodocyclaceae bacterium]